MHENAERGCGCAALEAARMDALLQLRQEAPGAAAQAEVIGRLCGSPVFYGGQAQWIGTGEAVLRAMLRDLARSRASIWLEYSVIRPGVMWDTIARCLRRAAAAGVQVRLLYGTRYLPRAYAQRLRHMRISAAPIACGGSRRMMIDGRICYIGTVNLSDEEIGVRRSGGKSGAVRIEGAAAATYGALFCARWAALCGDATDLPPLAAGEDYCYMQPFWGAAVGRSAIAALISRAERAVWLMTPHFAPGSMAEAVCLAARSGVAVRIIMGNRPHGSISKLLAAGVEVYAYRGVLRTALCCADGHTAVIGGCRQEDGLWLYGDAAVAPIEAELRQTLPLCRRVQAAGQV